MCSGVEDIEGPHHEQEDVDAKEGGTGEELDQAGIGNNHLLS